MRSCEACGKELPASAHPKRRFCDDTCRKRGVSTVVDLHPVTDDELAVTIATRKALESAGRSDTPTGQAALALAGRLDVGRNDTGSSLAAVAKELRATLAEALAGATAVPDALDHLKDDLKDRREKKAHASR